MLSFLVFTDFHCQEFAGCWLNVGLRLSILFPFRYGCALLHGPVVLGGFRPEGSVVLDLGGA